MFVSFGGGRQNLDINEVHYVEVPPYSVPNHQLWYAKMEAQLEYIHVAYMFLHVWRRFACSVGA